MPESAVKQCAIIVHEPRPGDTLIGVTVAIGQESAMMLITPEQGQGLLRQLDRACDIASGGAFAARVTH